MSSRERIVVEVKLMSWNTHTYMFLIKERMAERHHEAARDRLAAEMQAATRAASAYAPHVDRPGLLGRLLRVFARRDHPVAPPVRQE